MITCPAALTRIYLYYACYWRCSNYSRPRTRKYDHPFPYIFYCFLNKRIMLRILPMREPFITNLRAAVGPELIKQLIALAAEAGRPCWIPFLTRRWSDYGF